MGLNTDYKLKIEDNVLEIQHPIIDEFTFFDVCNLDGKICLTGHLNQSEERTKADLSAIPKGMYQLFIINGGSIFSERLKV